MLEIRADKNPAGWGNDIEIRLLDRQRHEYVEAISLKKTEEGMQIPVAISLAPQQAQNLMDQLWLCGLRPTEGTGSAGALAAVERHLGDMRDLAFRALDPMLAMRRRVDPWKQAAQNKEKP